jgi:hypothetical protein
MIKLPGILLALALASSACVVWQTRQNPIVHPPIAPPVTVPAPIATAPATATSAPTWRCDDRVLAIKADFGSLRDAHGDLIYTPNTFGAMAIGRYDDWAARQRAAGLTHMVVGDFHPGAYPGSPFDNPDMRSPAAIRAGLERILNTPSAEPGVGFTPIVMFDGGHYDDSTPRERVDRDWPVILRGLTEGGRDLRPCIVPVPGWELIHASDWTSADISYALEWMHAHGLVHIAVHNSPGRSAISSNPIEPDDPWQGDEAGSFKTHGGQYVEALLFQADPPRPRDHVVACDYHDESGACWANRWYDAVLRVGTGYHGWRRLRPVLFETVVYWEFHDEPGADAAYARAVATAGAKVCADLEVVCGFGNGLPQ